MANLNDDCKKYKELTEALYKITHLDDILKRVDTYPLHIQEDVVKIFGRSIDECVTLMDRYDENIRNEQVINRLRSLDPRDLKIILDRFSGGDNRED